MEISSAKKIAYAVTGIILATVFALMTFFILIDVPFLVYFSIPTALVYVACFYLIYKEKLEIYLWLVYGWMTLYMGVATVCLGTGYGFHFYCFSMIPVVYVVEYMSFKLGRNGVKSLFIAIGIALFYFLFMGYVSEHGPVFDRGNKYATGFMLFNSFTVFGYLVGYSNYLIRSIIKSEIKLSKMAHRDRLTELYNRHYMLEKLSVLPEDASAGILAMADIDDFKKINDTYGHNAGDDVLRTISSKMKTACPGCDIARWGGEEFLIYIRADEKYAMAILERMRYDIGCEPVVTEGETINVTVTVGMAPRQSGESLDEWINKIDKKLYTGKKTGKNRVVA